MVGDKKKIEIGLKYPTVAPNVIDIETGGEVLIPYLKEWSEFSNLAGLCQQLCKGKEIEKANEEDKARSIFAVLD
jgi:hypothetical protein